MKRKTTPFERIMFIILAYAGLGINLYSLIRKSLYTTELLHSFIAVILSTLLVITVHVAAKMHRHNKQSES